MIFEAFVWIVTGLAAASIFLDVKLVSGAGADPSKNGRIEMLYYARNIIFGLAGWLWLTILTALGLQSTLFPEMSAYLLSGSPITVLPAIFWGALIAWIASGKRIALGDDGHLSTAEQRIEWLFGFSASLISRAFRIALWTVGGAIALVLIFWIGGSVNERIASMAPSEAIVLGAIIIAYAIYQGSRNRR